MDQGSCQIGRVLGKPPPPPSSPSFGNSGRHSGQETIFEGFPMVLGSWSEIFENGDRGSAQNVDARLVSIVVWPGEPFLRKLLGMKKYTLLIRKYINSKIPMFIFPGTSSQNVFFRKCCTKKGAWKHIKVHKLALILE